MSIKKKSFIFLLMVCSFMSPKRSSRTDVIFSTDLKWKNTVLTNGECSMKQLISEFFINDNLKFFFKNSSKLKLKSLLNYGE